MDLGRTKKKFGGAPSTEGRAKIVTNKFKEAMNSLFAAVSVTCKPGFHLIVTIAMIAVVAGKKCSAQ